MAEVAFRPAARAEEERQRAGLDPLLQLVSLRVRQLPGRDGRVDAVLERFLQRSGERARCDAQLLGGVVDDCLAVVARSEPVGRDRRSSARNCGGRGDTGADLQLQTLLHLSSSSGYTKREPAAAERRLRAG